MNKRLLGFCVCFVLHSSLSFAQAIPNFNLPSHTFFSPSSAPVSDRKVFAWYMLGLGAFGGHDVSYNQQVAEYKAEISEAKSLGLDGFGLEYLSVEVGGVGAKQNLVAIAAMFEAAHEVGDFRLFFEFDQPDNRENKYADYLDLMKRYGADESYYKIQGRPLAGAYGADAFGSNGTGIPADAIEWWRGHLIQPLNASGINVYFVPTTFHKFGSPSQEIAGWGGVAQGQSVWEIQTSPIGGGISALEDSAKALHAAGQSWMSTVSTHYWVASNNSVPGWSWMPGQSVPPAQPNGIYFEHAGGLGLAEQWRSILSVQKPDWVIMLTWNDFNESYVQPVDDYRKYANGTGQKIPLGWYKPQAGMDELNRYYVQWYKTGVPPKIIVDGLFYAYRTHLGSVRADQDNRTPVTCGNGPILDNVYVTTALTAPAELQVNSGGVATKYRVAAGLRQTLVPFHTGPQRFSLVRNGKTIVTSEGEPVVDAVQFYDYWPTTGYAEASPAPKHATSKESR